MLIFTLLDPIKMTVSDLFLAVGRPELVVRVRLAQLVVMIAGLFALGFRFGIAGVALAVDVMLVVGIGVLLWQARRYVDISVRRLFGAPAIALAIGLAVAAAAVALLPLLSSDWLSAAVKIVFFSACYLGFLLMFERELLTTMWRSLSAMRSVRRDAGSLAGTENPGESPEE
jgi:O-antigen/teichoic acid export membrane protein